MLLRVQTAIPRKAQSICRSHFQLQNSYYSRAPYSTTCYTPSSSNNTSTIYALSTPHGKAGIAIVRVSGPAASNVWSRMVRATQLDQAHQRHAFLRNCRIIDSSSGETIDHGMSVFFHAPKSFTTEDTIELHIHSGPAVIARTLLALSRIPSCREANPGEFTQRAFQNGRIDLTQAEGIKDLIDAQTEEQRTVALQAVEGVVFQKLEALRAQLLGTLAMVEALIDFGEGESIEDGIYEEALQKGEVLRSTIQSYLSDSRRGEILRSGIKVAIFGPPNAGKSSLLNFLSQRNAAIVTPIPGTTRDSIEVSLDLAGLPVVLCDTAGLRETEDVVESLGIERAKEMIATADVALCVLALPDNTYNQQMDLHSFFVSLNIPATTSRLIVFNKADLVSEAAQDARPPPISDIDSYRNWVISLKTRVGVDLFLSELETFLKERFRGTANMAPVISRGRHRAHLTHALTCLDSFLKYEKDDVVLAAEELRRAARQVSRITGKLDIEDVLDEIFSGFCIGK